MKAVGFEPTRVSTSELESDALDHSATLPIHYLVERFGLFTGERMRIFFDEEKIFFFVWVLFKRFFLVRNILCYFFYSNLYV